MGVNLWEQRESHLWDQSKSHLWEQRESHLWDQRESCLWEQKESHVWEQSVGVWFGRFRISVKTDQAFEADLGVLGNEFEVLVGVLVGQFFDE